MKVKLLTNQQIVDELLIEIEKLKNMIKTHRKTIKIIKISMTSTGDKRSTNQLNHN